MLHLIKDDASWKTCNEPSRIGERSGTRQGIIKDVTRLLALPANGSRERGFPHCRGMWINTDGESASASRNSLAASLANGFASGSSMKDCYTLESADSKI